MYRTLSELRDSINRRIVLDGEDAPCAAFLFTKHDVTYYETGEEKYLNDEDTVEVLHSVGKTECICEQIQEVIEDEIHRILNKANS